MNQKISLMFLAAVVFITFGANNGYADASANDLCADADGPLAVGSVTPGTTVDATFDEPPELDCGTSVTAPGVWYTVVGTGNTMIGLSWDAVAGADHYEVFRTEGVFGCDFGKVKIASTSSLSFNDTGLQNGRLLLCGDSKR